MKNFLCNVIFKVLSRGIAVLNNCDSEINRELNTLPNGFCITLGVLPNKNYVSLIKKNNKFYITKKIVHTDLGVTFKNSKSALKVMLAKSSIAESFCRHDILVSGDIAEAMVVVRVINRVEKYLFPHFMTKRFLPKIKKETNSLKVYCKIFFSKLSLKGSK